MNVRTTILLEKPLLDRVRHKAHVSHRTLRETIRDLLLAGLARSQKSRARPEHLPDLKLGQELSDVSSRSRLYELWDKDR